MASRLMPRLLLSFLMVGAGVLHFARPDFFIRIVPDYLPNAPLLVAMSGGFEVMGGIGLIPPRTRRFASWGLIALYVAVFPANLNMALHAERFSSFPLWALWVRLPMQFGLIAWAWCAGRTDKHHLD